ncbi:hypothetical protein C8J57DRAFT_1523011 [Mycena rebaudengoi]|nr:hypothetical protein C8J57DRAFT_1523011 [Mycena rebaudengoi]
MLRSGSFPRSPILALRLCWCLGPPPAPLRRALAPLLSFALRSGPPAQRPCAASFCHVHPFVFMLRSGSFPRSPILALRLCWCLGPPPAPLRRALAPLLLFALRSGPPAQRPCAASFRHVHPFVFMLRSGSFPHSPILALRLCWCLGPPPAPLRRALAPLLLFALRSGPPAQRPCAASFRHVHPFVFMVFGLLPPLAHARPAFMWCLGPPPAPLRRTVGAPSLVRPAFETSCTEASCCLVSLMCSCCVQAPLPWFALASFLHPALRRCAPFSPYTEALRRLIL